MRGVTRLALGFSLGRRWNERMVVDGIGGIDMSCEYNGCWSWCCGLA